MVHCLNFLIGNGLKITEIVTDLSSSVAKTLGNYRIDLLEYINLSHMFTEIKLP